MAVSRSEERLVVFKFSLPVENELFQEVTMDFPVYKQDVKRVEKISGLSFEDFLRKALR
jgi:hypothetical protein